MPSQSKVYFFFDKVRPTLPDRKGLKRFIESIFRAEGKKLQSLNVIFGSDKRLLEINRDFLNHDYYTDIITFDNSEAKEVVAGEIYISVDRVKDNASVVGDFIKTELLRVIFHGVLHLCGYGDKKPSEIKKMRSREDHYLSLYAKRST